MEFKEIHKKDGGTIVFCNLEELLKEAFGVNTMKEVESHANGEEYIIHCPFCKKEGHRKHKLYVKTDLTVGHCKVCDRAYINITDEVNTKLVVPEFKNFGITNKGLQVVPLTDPTWTLDKFINEFDDFDQKGYDYLIGRHKYLGELYKILDFKFWDGNVVMPFKYKGEVFYYQIRFTGNSKIRYFFPPIEAKPPYIIEHGDNKKFIISEGVYDAIADLIMAPEYTPMAVLGSSISDYQLDFLREYVPEEIIVYMDETYISKRIATKIASVIDYCPIHIIKSSGEDPEECMKRRMKWNKPLQWIKSSLFKKTKFKLP